MDHFEVLGAQPSLISCSNIQQEERRLVALRALSGQELKALWRLRMLKLHPDKSKVVDGVAEALAMLSDARDVLCNDVTREQYLNTLLVQLQQRKTLASITTPTPKPSTANKPEKPTPGTSSDPKPSTADKPEKPTPGTSSDEKVSFQNGTLLPFQHHWKAQYAAKSYRNFRHKDCGGASAAHAQAMRFMSAVDALLAEYDSCKNAAARAAWLEPHQLKAKGTIAALREGFLHHVCNCKSPVLESTLAKTTPAPGSLPVGEDPGGKDVHGAFFCSEILQKKHPYVPLYFHSGCWQAMKNRGAKNTIHAAVMGWKYKSTWRGTKYVLSRNVEKLREVMGKLAEQHVDLSCLAYIVVTPDGLGTYETADMQSFSSLLGDLPRADFSVLIRMTYAYSANGSFKAWRIADSGPPQQVLVHFLLKPCEGESFQVVDIDRPDADLRSMTLAALYAAVGPQISRPPSDPPAPPREQGAAKVQVPVPDLQHTAAEAPKHMRFCLQAICGDKWSFWRALLFQINAEMQLSSAMHQAPPRTLVWMPRKLHSSIIGRMASSTA